MAITEKENAFVDPDAVSISLSQMFTETAAASNPTYLVLTVLDRDEYTDRCQRGDRQPVGQRPHARPQQYRRRCAGCGDRLHLPGFDRSVLQQYIWLSRPTDLQFLRQRGGRDQPVAVRHQQPQPGQRLRRQRLQYDAGRRRGVSRQRHRRHPAEIHRHRAGPGNPGFDRGGGGQLRRPGLEHGRLLGAGQHHRRRRRRVAAGAEHLDRPARPGERRVDRCLRRSGRSVGQLAIHGDGGRDHRDRHAGRRRPHHHLRLGVRQHRHAGGQHHLCERPRPDPEFGERWFQQRRHRRRTACGVAGMGRRPGLIGRHL